MASKKRSSGPAWQVILEEMRSQNRATIEAVAAFRVSLEERIERLDQESRDRDGSLALAIADLRREVRQNTTDIAEVGTDVKQNGADIAELKRIGQQYGVDIRDLKVTVQQNNVELRGLANKVDALNRLEERVAALERRTH
jgi:DNA repair ATPase RecN